MRFASLLLLLNIFIYTTTCTHGDREKAISSVPVPEPSDPFQDVEYLGNYDGDTLTVNLRNLPEVFGSSIGVRVRGIDTAEIRTKDRCEKEAAKRAQILVQKFLETAKKIRLANVERDKYFRILADVYADDRSLAAELLKVKLAVPYDGAKKPEVDWCLIGSMAH